MIAQYRAQWRFTQEKRYLEKSVVVMTEEQQEDRLPVQL